MDVSGPFIIPGIDVIRFDSELAGGPIELSVAIQGQDDDGERPPVVYVTDANAWYAAVTQIVGVMQTYHELPTLCLVGVGYPIGNPYVDRQAYADFYERRQPDLTPVPDPEHLDHEARGRRFLKCLVDEVLPAIESKYAVDRRRRVLLGDSIGGDFALHAMLARPGTFQGIVAGSPMLVRPTFREELERLAAGLAESGTPVSTHAFVGSGEYEPDRPRRFEESLEFLGPLTTNGLRLETAIFPGETHASVWSMTFTRGLRWLFEAP